MSQLVHIISPDGTRYERTFNDSVTPEQIVAALRRPDVAMLIGRSGMVEKKDKVFGQVVPHADPESPWITEHPETVICIGEDDGKGGFRELKRIAGPPVEKHKVEKHPEAKEKPKE